MILKQRRVNTELQVQDELKCQQQKNRIKENITRMEIKNTIPAFVAKTYTILNDPNCRSAISWTSEGKQFLIKNVHELESNVLPKYFRHSNLNSFIRQLNMYGFHKSRKDNSKIVFAHELFVQGIPQHLQKIRRKSKTQFINDQNIDPIQMEVPVKDTKDKSEFSIKMGKTLSSDSVQNNVQMKQEKIDIQQFKDTYQTIDSSTSIMLKPSWSLQSTIEEFCKKQNYQFRSFIERSEIFDYKGEMRMEGREENENGEQRNEDDQQEDMTSIDGDFREREMQEERVPSIRTIQFLNEVQF